MVGKQDAMPVGNIEAHARAICEAICRKDGMVEADIAGWVDRHWECAAAELEAGLIDEGGKVLALDWEKGLAACRDRIKPT